MAETRCKWIHRMCEQEGERCSNEAIIESEYCWVCRPKAEAFFRNQVEEIESEGNVSTR